MKIQLLIWTFTALLSCYKVTSADAAEIKIKDVVDGIKLSCGDDSNVTSASGNLGKEVTLAYKDENSGEYYCTEDSKLLVKFRTCDNCIEMDIPSIAGVAVGNLVATVAVGVAVYLIASKTNATAHYADVKKRSDRQPLVPTNRRDDPYQRLKPRQPGTGEYDQLRK